MARKKVVAVTVNMPAKLHEHLSDIVLLPWAPGTIEKLIVLSMDKYVESVIKSFKESMTEEEFNSDEWLVSIEKDRKKKQ